MAVEHFLLYSLVPRVVDFVLSGSSLNDATIYLCDNWWLLKEVWKRQDDLACKEDTQFDLVCRKGVKKVERFRSLNFFAQVQVDISLIFVYMDNFLPVLALLYPCRSF